MEICSEIHVIQVDIHLKLNEYMDLYRILDEMHLSIRKTSYRNNPDMPLPDLSKVTILINITTTNHLENISLDFVVK